MAAQVRQRARVTLNTPDGEEHHGNDKYCGIMFNVTSSADVKIYAVNAVTYSSNYKADATVFTVMGGFAEHVNNRESWAKQCSGPVNSELSRLAFSAPLVVKSGETLGIYVAASKVYCAGVTVYRRKPVSDASITISSGVTLAAEFEGMNKNEVHFIGGIEYTVDGQDFNNTKALNNLSQDLQAYCLSDDMADVTLIIGDSRLPAHGLILAARSSVFRAKLQHLMQENQTREVHIEGVEEGTIRAMLQFIYSGMMDPDILGEYESCLSVARAAHQYDLPALVEDCIDCLADHVHVGSVSDILLLADDMSCDTLKQQCLNFIGKHGTEVQDTEGFIRATQRHSLVLEMFSALHPEKTNGPTDANPLQAAINSATAAGEKMKSILEIGKGGAGNIGSLLGGLGKGGTGNLGSFLGLGKDKQTSNTEDPTPAVDGDKSQT